MVTVDLQAALRVGGGNVSATACSFFDLAVPGDDGGTHWGGAAVFIDSFGTGTFASCNFANCTVEGRDTSNCGGAVHNITKAHGPTPI